MSGISSGVIFAAAAVLILLFFAIFKIPVKVIFKLLINTVFGFILLFIVNFVGAGFDLSIAVNWVNALIIGIFGLPGLALILLLQWLALI